MNYHATIFGSSAPIIGTPEYLEAKTLGKLLTQKGFRVKNGGYFGTMEACSKGAIEGGQRSKLVCSHVVYNGKYGSKAK